MESSKQTKEVVFTYHVCKLCSPLSLDSVNSENSHSEKKQLSKFIEKNQKKKKNPLNAKTTALVQKISELHIFGGREKTWGTFNCLLPPFCCSSAVDHSQEQDAALKKPVA